MDDNVVPNGNDNSDSMNANTNKTNNTAPDTPQDKSDISAKAARETQSKNSNQKAKKDPEKHSTQKQNAASNTAARTKTPITQKLFRLRYLWAGVILAATANITLLAYYAYRGLFTPPSVSSHPDTSPAQVATIESLSAKLVNMASAQDALTAKIADMESRLLGMEELLSAISRKARPHQITQARIWLNQADKELGHGGFRIALFSIRAAAALLNQAGIPHMKTLSLQLDQIISSLENNPSVDDALARTSALITRLDRVAQSASKQNKASNTNSPSTPAERTGLSGWSGLSWVREVISDFGDALGNLVKIERTDQSLNASLEFVVVRRALLLAQSALLERDFVSWELAMRHARDNAAQTTSTTLQKELREITIEQPGTVGKLADYNKERLVIRRIVKELYIAERNKNN